MAIIKEQLFNRVVRFMKDNNVTCEETIYQTDRVITNAYQFLSDLFEIVQPELEKEGTIYSFSAKTKIGYNDNYETEVWISKKDDEGSYLEDDENLYGILTELKMDEISEGCYSTPFLAHYVHWRLSKSSYLEHSKEMQDRME